MIKEGSPGEVCGDREALERTNLEPPAVLTIYEKMLEKNLVKRGGTPPKNIRELEEML